VFLLTIEDEFAAAHYLEGYQGACAAMHGHTWKVSVSIVAQETRDLGMVVDFKDLKRILKKVLSKYDHSCLNNVIEMPKDEEGEAESSRPKYNPTAENMTRIIYGELEEALQQFSKAGICELWSVTIWESSQASCTYSRQGEDVGEEKEVATTKKAFVKDMLKRKTDELREGEKS